MLDDDLEIRGEDKQEDSSRNSEYRALHLSGMYQNWFLDYASYVILERAVPDIIDGLKPVQRRILHAMNEMDDGRFNKVANIIGQTMQYHPHGDASIGDALVQLGQKDLLIDTQGNWGNILTGDSAAAARYIEARPSKFAKEVIFNPKTTLWKLSYDGRKKEPVNLPVKFPLLLFQGVEGIAVGLASKVLPHNFIELIDASINILQGNDFQIYPDFPTGGLIDVSRYNNGERGGRVRVRAKIKKLDNKTLVINEIPFGVTTSVLIDTIIAASDKKKIKIRKIDDNTAENVEILIHLQPGVSPDQTIDALYAFTSCETPISPNACVISDGKPVFLDVKQILHASTQNTLDLLKKELEIRLEELETAWHFSSLEKIFIEKRIYRKIEECTSWESVIETIDLGLKPYKKLLHREVTTEDIEKLTEIKIKRISKYNAIKADEAIQTIETDIDEVKGHLASLTDYAIAYFNRIKEKYRAGRERKTEIRNFDTIEATQVAVANEKLYINKEEGFAGTGLKKDEYVCDCSDIDEIIIFREDGTMMVTKVESKFPVGKNVIHIAVFNRNDDRTIYNMVYRDGRRGKYYAKRFPVSSIIRDKEYQLTKGTEGSKIIYFTANANGEAELIKVNLKPVPRMKKTAFEFDFSTLAIKGRDAQGNILTKYHIRNINKKEEGISTLGGIDIWYDETVKRLNTDRRGILLGSFKGSDKILTINNTGHYKLFGFDLSTHFDEDMIIIEKYDPKKIITAIYIDGESGEFYVKRFNIEESDKKVNFLNDHAQTRLVELTLDWLPQAEIELEPRKDGKPRENQVLNLADLISVKSYKAKGKKLSLINVVSAKLIDPLPYVVPEEIPEPVDEKLMTVETDENGSGDEDPNRESESESEPSSDARPEITPSAEDDDLPSIDESGQITLNFD